VECRSAHCLAEARGEAYAHHAMKLRRRAQSPPPTVYVGDHTDKLSRIPALPHDEDERPRREDQDYAKNLFTDPPVPLPRFLTGAKKPRRRT
jgi:hypothetical protein